MKLTARIEVNNNATVAGPRSATLTIIGHGNENECRAALKALEAQPQSDPSARMNAIAFASAWCEKHGWNPDVIENFADALVEWQRHQ